MTALPLRAPGRWTRTRWWIWVGSIFAAQLALILLLSPRAPLPTVAKPPGGHLSLLTEGVLPRPFVDPAWEEDPAQLAYVSPGGFSGPVWRRLPRFEPSLSLRAEPPKWLTQDASQLAQGDGSLAAVQPPSGARSTRPAPYAVVVPALTQPLQTRSIVRVNGGLAGRAWLNPADPPSWPYPDVLPPSAVQVTVDHNGLVLSATILTRSGLAAADQWAVELARNARFEPAGQRSNASPLVWGRLVFQWHVIPPGTNTP